MLIKLVAPNLFRSDQPKGGLDLRCVYDMGIRRLIDLENEGGEAEWERDLADGYGIEVISIPLSGFWAPKRADIARALSYMITPDVPTLVHCKHGEDRTGLVVGMYRRTAQGVSPRDAWEEMLANGYHPALIGLTWHYWVVE